MPRLVKLLLGAMALLLVGLAYGQRPSELNDRGEAYLRVNINPTDVPPMVNKGGYRIRNVTNGCSHAQYKAHSSRTGVSNT